MKAYIDRLANSSDSRWFSSYGCIACVKISPRSEINSLNASVKALWQVSASVPEDEIDESTEDSGLPGVSGLAREFSLVL
jgi:hypothetical protein